MRLKRCSAISPDWLAVCMRSHHLVISGMSFPCQTPAKNLLKFSKKLEGHTDEDSSRQFACWCGATFQASGRSKAAHREGTIRRRQAGRRRALALRAALAARPRKDCLDRHCGRLCDGG